MVIEYLPSSGFKIGSTHILWDDDREVVREKLSQSHTVDDMTFDVSHLFDGDESKNIHQKRDIYENYDAPENYFFLNYTASGYLSELEIHSGFLIKIQDLILEFDTPIEIIIGKLSQYDKDKKEIEDGQFLFPNLKILIADNESMGSDGNGFSYFYTSKNITHLLE